MALLNFIQANYIGKNEQCMSCKDWILQNCTSETCGWDSLNVGIICFTIIILSIVIAYTVLKWGKNKDGQIPAAAETKPEENKEQAQTCDKELEIQRHANKIAELEKQANEERSTIEKEYNKVKEVLTEACSVVNTGLKISVTLKRGGNVVTITSPSADEPSDKNNSTPNKRNG